MKFKEKIIIFIIGFLAGSIISTGAFYIYTVTNSSNYKNPDMQMEHGQKPPEMPDGERPEGPENGESSEKEENSKGKKTDKSKKKTTETTKEEG